MNQPGTNADTMENHKFDSMATDWWNPNGWLRTLHDINPLRLDYIDCKAGLAGKTVVDIGCGAGLLTEAMRTKNAEVTGIDISPSLISTAREHAHQNNLDINYLISSPELFAGQHARQFDIVTCMEMLEHVPDPGAIVGACARLVKPGGQVFFSTINRTVAAYVFAVIGAEHLLKILPAGTHDYARFIRPFELSEWCRHQGLTVKDISGMSYSPFQRKAALVKNPGINYLLHAIYQ